MVRNIASMQSLRNNMEDMSFDAPPRRTLYQDSVTASASQPSLPRTSNQPPTQPAQHPIMQLCGTDDFTKQLMIRVATGVATETEQKAFAQQVKLGTERAQLTATDKKQKSREMHAAEKMESKRLRFKQATRENAADYTKPFCDFLTDNPTVFHCVDAVKRQLKKEGWEELSERDAWKR